ncbi:unnamed protein product [Brassica oleracea var. botrytis]|uniref:BnaC03g65250D protein n=3 Tax=Brassica TaxID=3705 RepID=A0A078FZ03_BRANA|nr:hypothetical protein HID58_056995 [Brassica napus]CAF1711333.1 unnamed protein product [Brassica napus]CDY17538.1 BnaC03g65250D [Brassica napus]VDC99916.1 unnamed protein product [Brassica oleracea]
MVRSISDKEILVHGWRLWFAFFFCWFLCSANGVISTLPHPLARVSMLLGCEIGKLSGLPPLAVGVLLALCPP